MAYVSYGTVNAVPKSMTLDEVAKALADDPEMNTLAEAITSSNWDKNNAHLKPYNKVRHELSTMEHVGGTIILKGTKLVILTAVRARVLEIAHETHQRIVKSKRLF